MMNRTASILAVVFLTAFLALSSSGCGESAAPGGAPPAAGTAAEAWGPAEARPEHEAPWEPLPAHAPGAAEPEPEERRPALENLMFLGDSMIYNPRHTLAGHGHQVLAGGGAAIRSFFHITANERTVGVESMGQMQDTLAGKQFNGAVVLLGANDIAYMGAKQAMEDYRELLEELVSGCGAPVFVLRLYPVGRTYGQYYQPEPEERTARAAELNRMLAEYCGETEGIYFLDATGDFTDGDGYLLHGMEDGLHIRPDYYETFYEGIERALRETELFREPE